MEYPATRTVKVRVIQAVTESWQASVEVPEEIKSDAEVEAWIKENVGELDYDCILESWPGDIEEIEVVENENG